MDLRVRNSVLLVMFSMAVMSLWMREQESLFKEEARLGTTPTVCTLIKHPDISPGLVIAPVHQTIASARDTLGLPADCELPQGAAPPVSGTELVFRVADGRCQLARAVPMSASGRLLCGLSIDINSASLDELQMLPGIGPVKARSLVELRHELGGFSSPRELTRVPGIGAKTAETLARWLIFHKNNLRPEDDAAGARKKGDSRLPSDRADD
jgi:competence ComEA-like helix-hairpin-helix protein